MSTQTQATTPVQSAKISLKAYAVGATIILVIALIAMLPQGGVMFVLWLGFAAIAVFVPVFIIAANVLSSFFAQRSRLVLAGSAGLILLAVVITRFV